MVRVFGCRSLTAGRGSRFAGVWVALCVCGLWFGAVRAVAVTGAAAPAWQATVVAFPTVQPQGVNRKGRYYVIVENIGGLASGGEVTVKDVLPAGLKVTATRAEPEEASECSLLSGTEVECHYLEPTVPTGFMVVTVEYEVESHIEGLLRDVASVSGGGAKSAGDEAVTRVGGEHETAPSGVEQFGFQETGPTGEPFRQAAGHPNLTVTTFTANDMRDENVSNIEEFKPVEPMKNLEFYLPLGFLGNPTVLNQCPASLVEAKNALSGCPQSSRAGSILPMILNHVFAHSVDPTHVRGIYSVTPEKGYAAEFAFAFNNLTFFMYATVVRRDGHYVVRVAVPDIAGIASFVGAIATFYGDIEERYIRENQEESTFDRGAFVTDPSDCEADQSAREAQVEFDTWKEPGVMLKGSALAFSKLEGCNLLSFTSTLSVKPQTTQAAAPSGYEVGLKVPQAPNGGTGLGTPPVKNVTVALPAGTTISPSGANGLEACQESGPQGINIEGEESEEMGADGLKRLAAGHCPEASQIATVRASTPLLHDQLEGHLFVAEPECGGLGQEECSPKYAAEGRLFRVYLELQAPESGVVIKLAGHASVDPETGRITTIFEENPQFPLSSLTVSTAGGARAPLANPQTCGNAVSEGQISSWASPYTGEAFPSDYFNVDWNGAGEPCPVTPPFAPSFTADTTSHAAGATSPFVLTMERRDREQSILSLATTLPPGLLAYVSRVEQCPAALASQAAEVCPPKSQIGTATVAVGSGSEPYYVTGKVYFTGPYAGAPFGLSIVVPATAGPFNLGYVLVRAALTVNPRTAQVDATSSDFPQILDGVPLRIRFAQLSISNQEFVLNPTSCQSLQTTGTIGSAEGARENVSSPLAVQDCRALSFTPTTTIATEAKASKAEGTGVNVKIAYPSVTQSNIAKTTISFPTQLPVRLETLRQACLAATFEANPATCPAASSIGTATVHTPILSNPLSGPIYLVSYGSAKFPNVAMVLQGEGVTLVVEGESSVSSKSVLKVTFPSVPDAPFSTFEASLPHKQYSQFTSARTVGRAQASQCGQEMVAPVDMTAQNGLPHNENVKLKIEGCPPAKPEVKLVKAKAGKHGLTVTVKTTMKGRLRIAGNGLKTLVRRAVSPGKHSYTLAYTASRRTAAHRHHKTHLTLTLTLTVGKQVGLAHKNTTL